VNRKEEAENGLWFRKSLVM